MKYRMFTRNGDTFYRLYGHGEFASFTAMTKYIESLFAPIAA